MDEEVVMDMDNDIEAFVVSFSVFGCIGRPHLSDPSDDPWAETGVTADVSLSPLVDEPTVCLLLDLRVLYLRSLGGPCNGTETGNVVLLALCDLAPV